MVNSIAMLDGLQRSGRFMGLVIDDFRRRLPLYPSDLRDGLNGKALASCLFMFFATFSSTVALGELVRQQTDNHVGVTEYLILQCLCGVIHALLAGQPLLILRPTGPITVFMTDLFTWAGRLEVDYFVWLGWVGLWVGLIMIAIAALDGCSFMSYFTRSLHELYSLFVCTIYISDGIGGIVTRFHKDTYGNALFALILAAVIVGIGLWLTTFGQRLVFTRLIRKLCVDYALTAAVFIAIGISYSANSHVHVDRIPLPNTISPTLEISRNVTLAHNHTITITHRRQWFVGSALFHTGKPWLPAAALLAAVPIVILFYIDQNISALLTQVPTMRLKKGSYYHASFLLVGLFNAIFPLFGLPFNTASLPHSPQFARALSDIGRGGQVERVWENRIAPTVMYLMCGLALFVPSVLRAIPEAAVDGILTFVGVAGIINGNQMVDRCLLLITEPRNFPKDQPYTAVAPLRMHLYTFIQLLCLGGCWAINKSPAGLGFPLFIILLVPFRNRVLTKIFTEAELEALDSEEVHREEEAEYLLAINE